MQAMTDTDNSRPVGGWPMHHHHDTTGAIIPDSRWWHNHDLSGTPTYFGITGGEYYVGHGHEDGSACEATHDPDAKRCGWCGNEYEGDMFFPSEFCGSECEAAYWGVIR